MKSIIAAAILFFSLQLQGQEDRVFDHLGAALAQPTEVYILDLSHQNIDRLTGDIAQLKNLKKLDLEGNQLTKLPESFSQLENLEELELAYNEFKDFPMELLALKKLKKLSIRGDYLNLSNQIKRLPEEIDQLQNLEFLDLAGTQLEELSESLVNLKQLKKILLKRSRISSEKRKEWEAEMPDCQFKW